MSIEQLEIMKVIEFPKNKEIAEQLKNNKLDVAIKILELLSEEGSDYHILVSKEDALKIFEANDKLRDYVLLSSNVETVKNLKLDNKLCTYEIKGDEFD